LKVKSPISPQADAEAEGVDVIVLVDDVADRRVEVKLIDDTNGVEVRFTDDTGENIPDVIFALDDGTEFIVEVWLTD